LAQQPEKIGQLAVQAGANVLQGKKVEEKISVTEENVEDSSE
jgi:ribose transport system substrate-binding protein